MSDHGTEFTCNAMLAWCKDAAIDCHFIAPGKPMQNGFIESFNGGCAMSCSTRPCSSIPTTRAPRSLCGAPTQSPAPHSSLKYLTYAAHLTATDDRLRNRDQLRRSSVAPPAPLGVQNPETLTAAG